ncbi:MAG TPA: peptidoglycan-binding protein [Chitinophagaceae bacterium]|jgi:putative peptidoglycan binding protein|nr:peptidoglycan-binding protein [Chitinophagaceae bacterium]
MALQLNDNGPLVRKWQQFLQEQGFFAGSPDGNFDNKTRNATIAFQKFHGIQTTGIAGSLTIGKATALGFNPDKEPQPIQINNDQKMMKWIKENLGGVIVQAVNGSDYTEDWLAGMCARETGFLFSRFANQGMSFAQICPLMKGDFGKRANDAEKIFHGFGFWQIDIASFPSFVSSDKWKDPLETATMAISVLDGKKNFLRQKGWDQRLSPLLWQRAITAAYNCGEGNVNKALSKNLDVDNFTFSKDYSKEVFRYRNVYAAL